ncbi:hypothetical protein Tco_0437845 [Tanacetum coccineum]
MADRVLSWKGERKGASGTCCGQPRKKQNTIVKKSSSEEEEEMSDAPKEKNQVGEIENTRENDNDLLKYLRSLDPDMVNELSKPSSPEVEEVIRELVQCTAKRFFKEETISDLTKDSNVESQENHSNDDDGLCDTIGTSRDYLAKLLFWSVLLNLPVVFIQFPWCSVHLD